MRSLILSLTLLGALCSAPTIAWAQTDSSYSDFFNWRMLEAPEPLPYDTTVTLKASRPYTDETGHTEAGKGTLYIRYGKGHDRLLKPLIIAEGINPVETETLGFLIDYQSSLGPEKLGAFGLVDSLYEQGYDLIYLDYADGGTHIQRNGLLFMTVLEWVNGTKHINGSYAPNMVIGMSMGGLVSRYAMVKMERAGINHEVERWLTIDTPHRGANFPIGFQYLVFQLADAYQDNTVWQMMQRRHPEMDPRLLKGILTAPATRQLLLHQAAEFYPNTPAPLYGFLRDTLPAMGMPEKCVRLAIANGPLDGSDQPANTPGEQMLHVNWNNEQQPAHTWALWESYRLANDRLGLRQDFWQKIEKEKLPTLAPIISYDMQFTAYGQDSIIGPQLFYRGTIDVSVFGQPLLQVAPMESYGHTPLPVALDDVPGSRIAYGILEDYLPPALQAFGTINVKPGFFVMVPTISSLNIGMDQPLETLDFYQKVTPEAVPYDAYTGQASVGISHLKLTPQDVRFILQHIDGSKAAR